jgi:hypothetical protein
MKIEIYLKEDGDVAIGLCDRFKKYWRRRKYLEIRDENDLDVIVHNTSGKTMDSENINSLSEQKTSEDNDPDET